MITFLRKAVLAAFALSGLALVPAAAFAQAYPNKPIRIVVPYDAGGLSDVTARNIGKELTARLGQPVLIENRPGATQIIGASYVAKSPADGYTLFFASLTSMVLNKHGFAKLAYEPLKDFAPVTLVTQTPLFLFVNDKFPAKTLPELVAAAKAKPGAYSYPSLGHGSSYHVVMEMFKAVNGIDVTHVPYKGSAPGLQALLKDEVQMMFDVGGISTQYMNEGRLRALAVTGAKRNPGLPNVPTLGELGVPGFELSFWFGIVAPAGTPKPIVDKLSAEIGQIVQAPDFRERAQKTGYTTVSTTPAEFASLIEGDLGRWEKMFKAAKIEPQQ
ncbi:Bug family tripartite tricarboxylate transporter substrate binding protein [Ramlibacter sp.]|uniref:Bug family tripartite tricarboxylate transporter substrate binding protein n=1 Tax=Ramlibacter sp. TaxID=1917967 RepID=UPI003D0C3BD5